MFPLLFAGTGVGLARYLPLETPTASDPPRVQAPRRPQAVVPAPEPTSRPPLVTASAREERLHRLERRLEELTARTEPPPPPPRPSREEAKRQLFQQHQQQLDMHSREPVDPTWSRSARDSFGADFASLTRGQGFTLKDIDCRSHTCVTTVEWPSYAAATQGYSLLLQHSYAMDCARSILLPEPSAPQGNYQARLLLDCANLR
ncbi:hypothetical protein [Melittangium boletus]|uniref:hypothetical protein n=1 Tax=Melittangium boletus TaxID=83453 RepID=UPI0012FD6D46|nr:hypothetical protein [Melittangium boletus]